MAFPFETCCSGVMINIHRNWGDWDIAPSLRTFSQNKSLPLHLRYLNTFIPGNSRSWRHGCPVTICDPCPVDFLNGVLICSLWFIFTYISLYIYIYFILFPVMWHEICILKDIYIYIYIYICLYIYLYLFIFCTSSTDTHIYTYS